MYGSASSLHLGKMAWWVVDVDCLQWGLVIRSWRWNSSLVLLREHCCDPKEPTWTNGKLPPIPLPLVGKKGEWAQPRQWSFD